MSRARCAWYSSCSSLAQPMLELSPVHCLCMSLAKLIHGHTYPYVSTICHRNMKVFFLWVPFVPFYFQYGIKSNTVLWGENFLLKNQQSHPLFQLNVFSGWFVFLLIHPLKVEGTIGFINNRAQWVLPSRTQLTWCFLLIYIFFSVLNSVFPNSCTFLYVLIWWPLVCVAFGCICIPVVIDVLYVF